MNAAELAVELARQAFSSPRNPDLARYSRAAGGQRPPMRVGRAGMLTEQPALVCARPSTVGRHERGRQ
jgi:hypothetical protein